MLKEWECKKCGWEGNDPSTTDASSTVERNGRLEIDRTHLAVCPRCYDVLSTQTSRQEEHAQ